MKRPISSLDLIIKFCEDVYLEGSFVRKKFDFFQKEVFSMTSPTTFFKVKLESALEFKYERVKDCEIVKL